MDVSNSTMTDTTTFDLTTFDTTTSIPIPTTTYGKTTLTGTALPTSTPLCNSISNPGATSIYLSPVTNQTVGYLKTCCGSAAPLVLFNNGCSVYCALQPKAIDAAFLCLNGTGLVGVANSGYEVDGDDLLTTTTTGTTATAAPTKTTATAKPSPSSGASRLGSSVLVVMAFGAVAVNWVLNA